MDGLGSLMQGAAPQGPQQGMPQQDMPMPMPPQNDPSMNAAMDLATDELDALNLDPRTKAALKTQEAYDLVQSAQRELVMAQEQPKPPTIEGQRTQQTLEGINALMQQLSPGIQQQGQQIAMAQRRSPMAQQGVSGMPARNMMRAAQGGIVGYAGPDGSQVKPTLGAMPQNVVSPDQIKQDAEIYQKLEAALAAATTPEDKAKIQMQLEALIRNMGNEHGKVMQYIDSTNGFTTPSSQMAGGGIVGFSKGDLINTKSGPVPSYPDSIAFIADRDAKRVAAQERATARRELLSTLSREETMRLASLIQELGNQDQALAILAEERKYPQYDSTGTESANLPFGKGQDISVLEEQTVGNVANIGGLAGLLATAKARQNEPPFRMQGVREATPRVGGVIPAAPAPVEQSEFDKQVEEELRAGMSTNVEEGATAAGDRFKELTGLGALAGQRNTLQEEARRLREERFSPERMKKRTLRAGLAGLAERGLGGFGSGSTSERDKIDAERAAAAGISIDEMNSLITENRAMGMSQFEAENAARTELSARQAAAVDASSTRVNAEATNRNAMARARMQAGTQTAVANIQGATSRAVAAAQASNSEFGRSLGIKIQELRQNEPSLTEQERESKALQTLFDQDVRVQLSSLGITKADQQRREITDSINSAIQILEGDITLMADPVKRQDEIMRVAEDIRLSYGSEGKTGPAVGTVKDGFRYKGGDPNVRSNWEKV